MTHPKPTSPEKASPRAIRPKCVTCKQPYSDHEHLNVNAGGILVRVLPACERYTPKQTAIRRSSPIPRKAVRVLPTDEARSPMPRYGRTKYGNKPTRSVHTGRLFQSKKEASREPVLLALQNVGEITDLKYQTPFRLELYATGPVEALLSEIMTGDLHLRENLAEDVRRSRQLVCKYLADFTYQQHGQLIVEDIKGHPTPVYKLKKRLMVLAHNIEIVEPGPGGVQQRARGSAIRGRGTGSRLMGGR